MSEYFKETLFLIFWLQKYLFLAKAVFLKFGCQFGQFKFRQFKFLETSLKIHNFKSIIYLKNKIYVPWS